MGLLGLTTLVVSEATRPGASREFYGRLASVLGADVDAVKRDYEATARTWWGDLGRWLAEHEGRLGLATAAAQDAGFRSIIGHAWSQVVVRASDIADFTEFFSTLGIRPGEELDLDPDTAPGEVFARWKAWVRRGGPVSERLRPVVDDPRGAAGELGVLVARILTDELAHWDGTARDAERRAVLALVVTANTFDRHELAFHAVVPAELAGRTVRIEGEDVDLGDAGDLAKVSIEVTADRLSDGVRLAAGPTLVRYVGRPIVPMALRESDMWQSVDQLEPGEDAYALVADWVTPSFLRVVPEPQRSSAVDNVPPGWVLYRDIETQPGVVAMGEHSAALIPRTSDLPHLRGGLRLGAAQHYLVDGAPDVVVPGVEGLETKVTVDGEPVACFGPEGGVARLADQDLGPGEHVVCAGARRFRVALEPFDWWEPPSEPLLAHVFQPSDLASVVRVTTAADEVFATGALVVGVVAPSAPVLLRVPDEAVLLGHPGEMRHALPATPPWAKRAGLPLAAFEPLARLATDLGRPFVPLWVAHRSGGAWHVHLISGPDGEAKPCRPDCRKAWAREVLALRAATPEGRGAEAAWDAYVAVAAEVGALG